MQISGSTARTVSCTCKARFSTVRETNTCKSQDEPRKSVLKSLADSIRYGQYHNSDPTSSKGTVVHGARRSQASLTAWTTIQIVGAALLNRRSSIRQRKGITTEIILQSRLVFTKDAYPSKLKTSLLHDETRCPQRRKRSMTC